MSKKIFASPQDVETAFYESLERGDLDTMMAIWSEDDEVVCVHPGGPRLVGYATVREGWKRIFDNGSRLEVRRLLLHTVTTPFAVMHSLIEQIGIPGREVATAPVVATNLYTRGPLGWRMVAHHASPMPPDSLVELPKTLH